MYFYTSLTRIIMKKILVLCLLVAPFFSFSQEFRIKKGAVTDSLQFPGDIEESFAIYLPSNYSPEEKWPLIFVFDPQGRGAAAANLFRYAAEDRGYIVASANFSLKSEPIDSLSSKALLMMRTLFNSFPIDQKQVFSAGIDEGGQIASAISIFYPQMAGVLSIGNSFVIPKGLDKDNPYLFIGMAGRRDYMIYVMENYLKYFDKNDFPTEADYYDGKEGQWPPSSIIYNAVGSFTLQSIRDGNRENSEGLVDSIFQKEMDYVESLRRKREFLYAYQKLEQMEKTYEDFGKEEAIESKMKEIKTAEGYKTQKRNFNRAVIYERQKQDEFEYLLRVDIISKNFKNIGWWAYQVDELNKLKDSDNEARSNMAYRLHSYIDFITKREQKAVMNSSAEIDLKVFINVLRTAIQKEEPEAYLNIISLAGSDYNYDTALLYLEDLLKTGYSDMDALYEIPGTLDLKLTRDYNQLIKKYLGTARYFNEDASEEKEISIEH